MREIKTKRTAVSALSGPPVYLFLFAKCVWMGDKLGPKVGTSTFGGTE